MSGQPSVLSALKIPGLFVIGAQPGAGSTYVAGAVANWFVRRRFRCAVCVPVATGVRWRREGLVSEEAEFLARWSDARHPLDVICPQRFSEPLDPAVAARLAGKQFDWDALARSLDLMSRDANLMLVIGPAGVMSPLDQ
jgi:dethiobiotin synthetase